MSKISLTLIALFFVATLVLGACSVLYLTAPVQPQADYAATAMAQAVDQAIAQYLTQIAQSPQTGDNTQPTPSPVLPSPTVPPTDVPLPTATPQPVVTTEPTQPPAVVFTPTATPIPCNRAQFISDVTVEDGTRFSPGVSFTKTWRLKNTGSCIWTKDYALVFVSGDSLGAAAAISLKGDIKPGETVDLSAEMKAPAKVGDYRGYWKLRSATGAVFGIDANADTAFWVKITVKEPTQVVYNFADQYCKATWRNAENFLVCPGTDADSSGYVLRLDRPILENGVTENEPALVTHPQWVADGVIHGRYPEFNVKAGDHFKAVIGCLAESNGCRVTFKLRYRIGGGDVKTLAHWEEKIDGKITKVDVDLTPLAGQSVQFILSIGAKDTAEGDKAFWLNPRILR